MINQTEAALTAAAQLAADADAGRYTVDGRQVDGGQVACILVDFLDRASPATAPHAWRWSSREGFAFRASACCRYCAAEGGRVALESTATGWICPRCEYETRAGA